MSLLRTLAIFCMTLLLSITTKAQDRMQSQITAAASNAVDKLAADVLDEPIGVDLTVADFVSDTQSLDKLMSLLRQAEQIGGPRWLDDQTCQVKLAIEAPRVLELLRQTAELNGNHTPIPAQALVKRLKDWKERTFVATGTAISLLAAQELRPPAMGAWDQIPEEERRKAVLAAADNAATKAINELKTLEYQPGETLSQALTNQAVQGKLRAFLSDRPVTSVQYANDGSVETTLSLGQDELVNALLDALQAGSIEVSKDAGQLKRLHDQLDGKLNVAVGKARASDVQYRPAGARLPNSPPEWLRDPITITGTAPGGPSRLKSARQAEDLALQQLRKQLESLPLSNSRTIGEFAAQDVAVRRVLDDMMIRAKVSKIDYAPDGSVNVRMTLDPRDLWDELRELP